MINKLCRVLACHLQYFGHRELYLSFQNLQENNIMKKTWEKIFEYASMPVHGTLSRRLRKGVALQINESQTFEKAVIFLGDEFVRITEEGGGKVMNSYFDWAAIQTIKTASSQE